MDVIELQVNGMHCGACENRVQNAVGKISGVQAVRADHTAGRVEIEAAGAVDREAVRAAIVEEGYEVVS